MTQYTKNVGYGLGHIDPHTMGELLDELATIDLGTAANYPLNQSRAYIERVITPMIDQYNQEFNYPNSIEIMEETRPLKLAQAEVVTNTVTDSRVSVMRAIICLNQDLVSVHYTDTLGRQRSQPIPVEMGTCILVPSALLVTCGELRVQADFIFNMDAEILGDSYRLPS